MVLPSLGVQFRMVLDRYGWMRSSVVAVSPDSLTVLPIHLEPTTVATVKMLELLVV